VARTLLRDLFFFFFNSFLFFLFFFLLFTAPPCDLKVHESALRLLSRVHRSTGAIAALSTLVTSQRSFFVAVPRARAGKIVRVLLDDLALVPGSEPAVIEVCRGVVAWARAGGREYLSHRVELRLARALVAAGEPAQALAVAEPLSRELRKVDDKTLGVAVSLVESLAHAALRDAPRAKACLTTARTAANSVYTRPTVQAELDLQVGWGIFWG
jgi:26S proteasome regulatory subunit N6